MSNDSFKAKADLQDASYRSAMAVSIENILKLASLTDDYDAYELASQMLNKHAQQLNEVPISSPTAVKVALMLQNPIIVIKASKENILAHQNEIANLSYPFILVKAVKEKDYTACTLQKCFSTHDSMEKVLQDIEGRKF